MTTRETIVLESAPNPKHRRISEQRHPSDNTSFYDTTKRSVMEMALHAAAARIEISNRTMEDSATLNRIVQSIVISNTNKSISGGHKVALEPN